MADPNITIKAWALTYDFTRKGFKPWTLVGPEGESHHATRFYGQREAERQGCGEPWKLGKPLADHTAMVKEAYADRHNLS